MAKKQKSADKNIEEIKRLIKLKKVIIGTERVVKMLRQNKMERIFLASNCKKESQDTIMQYSKMAQTEIISLKYPNDELGVLCKKPYAISALGILR
jgi:large subunit ribosomal protein L30e